MRVRRRGAGAYGQDTEPFRLPTPRDPRMSDKSPRQSMTKKSGKSIKEKRAEKRGAAEDTLIASREAVKGKKR